jgi:proliferating cell nuclear antigen
MGTGKNIEHKRLEVIFMSEEKVRKYLSAKINVKHLRKVFDAVHHFSEEIKLNVTPEGINIKQVDESHVVMVNIMMKKELFEEYKASDFELGICVEKLLNLFKLAKGDEIAELYMDDKKDDTCIYIRFGRIDRRIGCIDLEHMKDPKIPNIHTSAHFKLIKQDIDVYLKASRQIVDFFKVKVTKNILELSSEYDADRVRARFEDNGKNDEKNLEIKAEEDTMAMYTTDYVLDSIKPAAEATLLAISYGTDKPIKIDYEMDEGNLLFNYMVAPRIENE